MKSRTLGGSIKGPLESPPLAKEILGQGGLLRRVGFSVF